VDSARATTPGKSNTMPRAFGALRRTSMSVEPLPPPMSTIVWKRAKLYASTMAGVSGPWIELIA
jgi:hypothetical protein